MRVNRSNQLILSILFSGSLVIALMLLFSSWAISTVQAERPFSSSQTSGSGSNSNIGWIQGNKDGFGIAQNDMVSALEPFVASLFAGTYNIESGAQIWRSSEGLQWSPVVTDGFGVPGNEVIDDLIQFGNYLYASTANTGTGGEIWRTSDGMVWEPVSNGGFGDADNVEVFQLVVFSDTLYAGTGNLAAGAEIWQSPNGTSWTQANLNGFGNANNSIIGSFAVFNDHLYAGTWNSIEGAEIRRTNGLTWSLMMSGGFDATDNQTVTSLAVFENELYALSRNFDTGSEVWRSPDGSNWNRVVDAGFGDPNNNRGYGLKVYGDHLYLVTGNRETGAQVWRTMDGETWEQIGFDGWGDPTNVGSLYDNGMAIFDGKLFVGTIKEWEIEHTGGEVWLYPQHPVYLPVLFRQTEEYLKWVSSGHADAEANAFTHWDEEDPPEVPTTCAKCHSSPGFLDFLGEDGSPAGEVDNPAPIGTVIDCDACHNPSAETLHNVQFPSGMLVTDLGPEAHCMVCHQGRNSTTGVNNTIAAAGVGADEVMDQQGFLNPHYLPAGATLYGTEVKGAYEYTGHAYKGRYLHVQDYDTCVTCHDSHSLSLERGNCISCHDGAETTDDFKQIRTTPGDFDGDGDEAEGIAQEIGSMWDTLFAAMQAYASSTAGVPLVFDPARYPYFFTDTDGDGIADPDETDAYANWTPRLLRAAYNLKWVDSDPGSYTHNGLYILQVLFDSLEDVGGDVSGMVRP